ncbi:MAG TPA: DUF2019 domain-containing protein [Pseudolabrys sp.]|nr:DUF2019 domain-containing protein [Pseudolabrys sp.]
MKPFNLQTVPTAQLVERFASLGLGQYQAELMGDIAKENRLLLQMRAVTEELKSRPGDQRSALLGLYDHPNVQVRLMAARLTLAVAPATARHVLESIKASKEYPHAADAGMCLWNLDRGVFKPT